MNVTFSKTGPDLTEHDVIDVERRLGIIFPPKYRRFLLKYNGGCVDPESLCIPTLRDEGADVDIFLGIGRKGSGENIDKAKANYGDRIPRDAIPIASDPFGVPFIIYPSESEAIYYIDFLVPGRLIHPVAESIDELLCKLQPYDS